VSNPAVQHHTTSEGPRIVFRCDASVEIGSGHVMRCLTLADEIARQGGTTTFLCRDLPGHMMATVVARGHAVHALPAPAIPAGPADPVSQSPSQVGTTPAHAGWLGVSVREDMEQSRAFLDRHGPDRVIVDHYALDAVWQAGAVPSGVPIMVIDDLADRRHLCDLLLDQNLGRRAADYDGLVPAHAQRLTGPGFALLRPEFAARRPASLARRRPPALNHVLVAMGGMDRDDTTSRVLDCLAEALPKECRVSIVMGQGAPALDKVRARAARMPQPATVLVGVADMATLMADADLAIGGAGGTAWERCCLGLPALLLILAENQRPGAEALDRAGAAVLLGEHDDPGWQERLTEWLGAKGLLPSLERLSDRAALLTEGLGTEHSARVICERALL